MAKVSFIIPPKEDHTPFSQRIVPDNWQALYVDSITLVTESIRRRLVNVEGMAMQKISDDYLIPFPFKEPNHMTWDEAVKMVEVAELQAKETLRPWVGSTVTLKNDMLWRYDIFPKDRQGKVTAIHRTKDGRASAYAVDFDGTTFDLTMREIAYGGV